MKAKEDPAGLGAEGALLGALAQEGQRDLLQQLFEGVFLLDRQRRIRFWNAAAERLTGYPSAEVIGKCCSQNILTHLDQQGRKLCRGACPASRTIFDGKPREVELYLHHRDGHRVPVTTRVFPLRAGGGRIVGALQAFCPPALQGAALAEEAGRRLGLLSIDEATGVATRALLEQTLEARFNELRRFGWSLGVVQVRCQGVSELRATLGVEAACRVLAMAARSLRYGLRSFDLVGRWSEHEFVCLVVNVDREGLQSVGTKLARLVHESSLEWEGGDLRVEAQLAATLARVEEEPPALLARLSDALLQSPAKLLLLV